MKFKFRYDSVLAVKELLVNEKQRELQEENLKIQHAHERLSELKKEILSVSYSLEDKKVRNDKLIQLKSYQNFLLDKVKNQRGIIKQLEFSRDKILHELISLTKEKKVIEKLKEKHLELFNERRRKIEEKMMNEFAVQKFVRGEK